MAQPSDHFRQQITYAVVTGRDSFGKPTLSAKTTAAARVQPHRKLMKDARGGEFLSTHVIYTAALIDLDHRIWVPGTDTADLNQARRAMAFDSEVDGAGVERYRKVYLG